MPSDYQRVAAAISYLERNVARQPRLEELAAEAGLSLFQFHRLFGRWAGITPKRFLEYLTVRYARERLDQYDSVLEAAYATGLSGAGRLHDQFIAIEAVTPGEYRRQGAGLTIRYGLHGSPFGTMFIAATGRGICALSFHDHRLPQSAIEELHRNWRGAAVIRDDAATGDLAARIFAPSARRGRLHLQVRGTNFQVKVWEALLRVPSGALISYGDLARAIGRPGAARAVGGAVGRNPVAYLIPCHRVLQGMGVLGGYRWGTVRKRALIGWEAARFVPKGDAAPAASGRKQARVSAGSAVNQAPAR